jgi:cytoskeletal protein CcmA (bactofilin family)
MFNKENKPEKFKDAETIIGASIKVKGNFHGQGNIVVEGQLEGNLRTEANLFIGEKAKVVANIEANDAIINGEVKGALKIHQYLALGPTAKIFGDINYSEISIEKGAIINGQIIFIQNSGKATRGKTVESEDISEEDETTE